LEYPILSRFHRTRCLRHVDPLNHRAVVPTWGSRVNSAFNLRKQDGGRRLRFASQSTMAVATADSSRRVGVANWDKRQASQSLQCRSGYLRRSGRRQRQRRIRRERKPGFADQARHHPESVKNRRSRFITFGVYKPKGRARTISTMRSKGHRQRGRYGGSELRAAQQFRCGQVVVLCRRSGASQSSPIAPPTQ